jgi:mannose-6-phosphate isomerase-like protein (cupin superfamily)
MAFHLTRASDRAWRHVPEVPGLREATLVGAGNGAIHLEVSLCELEADATVEAHLHPFEESWYVLAGAGRRSVGSLEYDLSEGDFGVVPVGIAHRVEAAAEGLTWLSVRAPRPPRYAGANSAYPAGSTGGDRLGRPDETDPRHRYAGHFAEEDLGPYGPISMPGYHGPNIRNISIRMLVDGLLGARHHTLFVVEFAPRAGAGKAAREHYHPFEEIYFLLSGHAQGILDGQPVEVGPGDLAWVGVDATHSFVNEGGEPVRWLEVQSPVPPESDAFFFPDDWREVPTW